MLMLLEKRFWMFVVNIVDNCYVDVVRVFGAVNLWILILYCTMLGGWADEPPRRLSLTVSS